MRGGVGADERKRKSHHPTKVKPEAYKAGGFTELTKLGVRVVWAWLGTPHLVWHPANPPLSAVRLRLRGFRPSEAKLPSSE